MESADSGHPASLGASRGPIYQSLRNSRMQNSTESPEDAPGERSSAVMDSTLDQNQGRKQRYSPLRRPANNMDLDDTSQKKVQQQRRLRHRKEPSGDGKVVDLVVRRGRNRSNMNQSSESYSQKEVHFQNDELQSRSRKRLRSKRNKSVSQVDKSVDSKKSAKRKRSRSKYQLNMSKEKKKRATSAISGKSNIVLTRGNCVNCQIKNSRSPHRTPLRNPRVNQGQTSSILVQRKQSLRARAEYNDEKVNQQQNYKLANVGASGPTVNIPALKLDKARQY